MMTPLTPHYTEIKYDDIDWGYAFLISFMITAIGLAFYFTYQDAKDWQKFSQEHNCKKIAEVSSTVSTGFGSGIKSNGKFASGTITTVTPGKTGYRCDDGVDYWR